MICPGVIGDLEQRGRKRTPPKERGIPVLIFSTQNGKSTKFGEVWDIPHILVGGFLGRRSFRDTYIGKSKIFL